MNNHIELLAPCGSYESLHAAAKGGADSIYFGIEQLNMRTRSTNNFEIKDLPVIRELCNKYKLKAYLTLNTILYNHDMALMRTIMDEAKKNNIDAIIACDHAVFNYARKIQIPIHISTQANITNIETVEFYATYADVMVLSRELTLEQVKEITIGINEKKITGPGGKLVKVEIFAHGALCMAVSGKCYLSLHTDFASANRGACTQNCRRSYIVTDKESGTEFEIQNEYIMSAKDLSTIGFLDKIISSGVSVLKIEGRARAEEYVYTVTKCYREAIDSIIDNSYNSEKKQEWEKRLSTVFNRGFWEGYYLGREIGEWNNEYGSKATTKKIYIGKGIKYFEKAKVGEFKIESQSLEIGDEIMISGPTTGIIQFQISEMRLEDKKINSAKKGETISIPLSEKIRPSDKLYKFSPVK